MKTIRVGGVPEHFNLPWHLNIENGKFAEAGVNVLWRDFPEGTGAMNKALRSGEIDAAVILTEGVTRDIIAGNASKIVQVYVGTPLIWGIHVDASSSYRTMEDIEGKVAAISREGSGSHLMAYVNAKRQGWDRNQLKFKIVDNIDGAVKALKSGEADYFMWEHFTTKPLVDNNTFRLIDDCPTPWPCFVIAVRAEVLKFNPSRIKTMLEVLNSTTQNIKGLPEFDKMLSGRYQQKLEDIKEWLEITEWSQSQISLDELNEVQNQLYDLQLINKKIDSSKIIFNL